MVKTDRGSGGAIQGRKRGRSSRGGVAYFDPASDPVMMDALRLLFAKEGNYVQDLVREGGGGGSLSKNVFDFLSFGAHESIVVPSTCTVSSVQSTQHVYHVSCS